MSVIFTIVSIPIFVILLTVIYRTIKSAMDCTDTVAKVLAVCVSILALIGMNQFFQGTIQIILIPYATLGLLILALLLFLFFGKHIIIIRKHFHQDTERKHKNERLNK